MTQVVDKFVLELGLDSSEFAKNLKEIESLLKKFLENQDKQTKEVGLQVKKLGDGFRQVKNELLGLVAVAFGAKSVKDFFGNMVNGQAALGRVAKNLGESAREIDAWGAAVESVGGTAAGFQASMQAMQSGFEAFKLGENSPVVQAFRALGVNITDDNGKIRPMRDLLLDLSGAIKQLAPQDQIRVAQMLGIDEGTLNLLRQGREEVGATVEHLFRASGVTEQSTAKAAEAQAQWSRFKRELYGVGQTIFEALIPAFGGANKALLWISGWVQENKDGIGLFFEGISSAVVSTGKALAEIAGLIGTFFKIPETVEKIRSSSAWDKLGEGVAKFFAYGGDKKAAGALAASGVRGYGSAASSSSGGGLFDSLEKKFGLPSGTLDKIWAIESGRGKNMVSSAGATGHFQFMPATARQFGLSRDDTFDLTKSATAAAQYLAQLLKKYGGDMQMAVSAYNMGPGNLDRRGLAGAKDETINYWRKFQSMGGGGARGNVTTTTTNIQNMTINTKATDAAGISRDMYAELDRQATMNAGTLAVQ